MTEIVMSPAEIGTIIAIVIMVIGIVMGLKWKYKNFKGSPSKGVGPSPFRREPHDFDKDQPSKGTTETEFATPPDDDKK